MSTSLINIGPPTLPPLDFSVHFLNAKLAGKADPSSPDCFLLLPPPARHPNPPLILVPHGGPHGMSPSVYIAPYAFLADAGYAVLHVNFRGSTGYGKAFNDVLAGEIGSFDVQDCMAALQTVLDGGFGVDGERVGVCGGSHGGFLAGHLIGQFPDTFKAAAMRNPVTNVSRRRTEGERAFHVNSFRRRRGGDGRQERKKNRGKKRGYDGKVLS